MSKEEKSFFQKIKVWYRAVFLDYRYWYVLYGDNRRTYLLHKGEAKGLAEVFNGKLKIDYENSKLY